MAEAPGKFYETLASSPPASYLFLPSLPQPSIPTGLLLFYLLVSFNCFVSSIMQRALTARTSVLSAASKRAPFYRSGLNLQQQRFAHKVRDASKMPIVFGLIIRWPPASFPVDSDALWFKFTLANSPTRTSSLASKPVLVSSRVLIPSPRPSPRLWALRAATS